MILTDRFGRKHDYLRISLTDRCNLNCFYCSPQQFKQAKINKSDLLNFDELTEIIEIFVSRFEIKKVRFTGGEPFARRDIIKVLGAVSRLKSKYDFETALTTNGTLIQSQIRDLKSMGINKLNISLDTLNKETFREITGHDNLNDVLTAIKTAEDLDFDELKVNTVVLKGINEKEIEQFIDFVKSRNITLRFIEYMPFGTNGYSESKFLSMAEVKERVSRYAGITKHSKYDGGVAELFTIDGYKGKVGFISPMSNHFCGSCNRLRIKSDGRLKLCLFSDKSSEVDLKSIMRRGGSYREGIVEAVIDAIQHKEREHAGAEKLVSINGTDMVSTGG